jgi:hypothetical protein
MKKLDEPTFINQLIKTFPQIKEEVLDEDWAGVIGLQIGYFRRYTQKAIDTNNVAVALQCFLFVENIINNVEFAIENSLIIQWIGKLNFETNKDLFSSFPVGLKKLRDKLNDDYNKHSDNEKLNSFLKKVTKDNG